jgi:hypothetical protein
MPGPSKESPPSGPEDGLLVCVERLRQQAEAFHRTVEEEFRALLEELRIRQAKRPDP